MSGRDDPADRLYVDTGEDKMTPSFSRSHALRAKTTARTAPALLTAHVFTNHRKRNGQPEWCLGTPPRCVRAEAAREAWTEDRPATRADAEHRHEITGARTGTMLTTVWLGSAVYTAVVGGIAALFYSS